MHHYKCWKWCHGLHGNMNCLPLPMLLNVSVQSGSDQKNITRRFKLEKSLYKLEQQSAILLAMFMWI